MVELDAPLAYILMGCRLSEAAHNLQGPLRPLAIIIRQHPVRCAERSARVQESQGILQYVLRNLAHSKHDSIHVLCVILQKESREEQRKKVC